MKEIIKTFVTIAIFVATGLLALAQGGMLRATPGMITGISQYHVTYATRCNAIVPSPTNSMQHRIAGTIFVETVNGLRSATFQSGWSTNGAAINKVDDGHQTDGRTCWEDGYK